MKLCCILIILLTSANTWAQTKCSTRRVSELLTCEENLADCRAETNQLGRCLDSNSELAERVEKCERQFEHMKQPTREEE